MAKQREFESPPEGHVGLLVYDSVNNKWYAVLGDSSGHIMLEVTSVALPTGAATAAKQLVNDHDVTVSNQISGFATALKQLANDHDVNVSNMISGFATAAKQLANDHDVNVSNTDIEVVQPTPADLKIAQHQYDGSNWRKSNLLWGYNDIWEEDLGGIATGTTYSETSETVPVGEVWVLQACAIRNNSRDTSNVEFYIDLNGTGFVWLVFQSALTRYNPTLVTGQFTLGPGSKLIVAMSSTQNGDTIKAGLCGYKMKLDM